MKIIKKIKRLIQRIADKISGVKDMEEQHEKLMKQLSERAGALMDCLLGVIRGISEFAHLVRVIGFVRLEINDAAVSQLFELVDEDFSEVKIIFALLNKMSELDNREIGMIFQRIFPDVYLAPEDKEKIRDDYKDYNVLELELLVKDRRLALREIEEKIKRILREVFPEIDLYLIGVDSLIIPKDKIARKDLL